MGGELIWTFIWILTKYNSVPSRDPHLDHRSFALALEPRAEIIRTFANVSRTMIDRDCWMIFLFTLPIFFCCCPLSNVVIAYSVKAASTRQLFPQAPLSSSPPFSVGLICPLPHPFVLSTFFCFFPFLLSTLPPHHSFLTCTPLLFPFSSPHTPRLSSPLYCLCCGTALLMPAYYVSVWWEGMTRMLKERKNCKRRKGRDLLNSLCVKHTKLEKVTQLKRNIVSMKKVLSKL